MEESECDPGNQSEATSKDDCRSSWLEEGAKYYTENYARSGKLFRQCIVSEDCPKKHQHFWNRIDMMRHLKEVHNIDFNIPRLPVGRPRSANKMCKKNFQNDEVRVQNAWKRFHAGLPAKDSIDLSEEGAKYYTEKYIRPGKLVRQCIVSEDCPNKHQLYEKRLDMMRHLKVVHDVRFDIPRLPVGRPRFSLNVFPTPNIIDREEQMTEMCSKKIQYAVKNARNIFRKGLSARAAAAWQDYKGGDLSEEEFKKKFIEDRTNEWESRMPQRVEAIKKRIEKEHENMKWIQHEDINGGNHSVPIHKDDSRSARLEEGAKYYTEKYIRPGKLVRQCIVSEDCPNKKWHYQKRLDLMRHLKEVHNIDFDIPRLPMGRPRFSHLALAPTMHIKNEMTEISRRRFEDLELKVKNARKKFRAGLFARAAAAWQDYKEGDLNEENFREKYIEDKMNVWEAEMPKRVEAIKKRIEKGYDSMRRTVERLTGKKKTGKKKTGERWSWGKIENVENIIQLRLEKAWKRFQLRLPKKAIYAWEDYFFDDLSEEEFRKKYIEGKIKEWEEKLPQRIETIREQIEKSYVKMEQSKHEAEPNMGSENPENMTAGVSPSAGVTHAQTRNECPIERSEPHVQSSKGNGQHDENAEGSLASRCAGNAHINGAVKSASNIRVNGATESESSEVHANGSTKSDSFVCVNGAAESEVEIKSVRNANKRMKHTGHCNPSNVHVNAASDSEATRVSACNANKRVKLTSDCDQSNIHINGSSESETERDSVCNVNRMKLTSDCDQSNFYLNGAPESETNSRVSACNPNKRMIQTSHCDQSDVHVNDAAESETKRVNRKYGNHKKRSKKCKRKA